MGFWLGRVGWGNGLGKWVVGGVLGSMYTTLFILSRLHRTLYRTI